MASKLEHRYFIIKRSDHDRLLDREQQNQLYNLLAIINEKRAFEGRDYLECVVIEKDWPEYTKTLDQLMSRVDMEAKDAADRRSWANKLIKDD